MITPQRSLSPPEHRQTRSLSPPKNRRGATHSGVQMPPGLDLERKSCPERLLSPSMGGLRAGCGDRDGEGKPPSPAPDALPKPTCFPSPTLDPNLVAGPDSPVHLPAPTRKRRLGRRSTVVVDPPDHSSNAGRSSIHTLPGAREMATIQPDHPKGPAQPSEAWVHDGSRSRCGLRIGGSHLRLANQTLLRLGPRSKRPANCGPASIPNPKPSPSPSPSPNHNKM